MNIIRFLSHRLKTVRGKTIVHVGAHYGQEANRYQFWGAKRVVWVEASPEIFEKLQVNIAIVRDKPPSWFAKLTKAPKTEHILINALVGETNSGTSDFHIFSNSGASNSIFKMKRDSDNQFASIVETGEVLKLGINTLDASLTKIGVAPESVDILVMDIQGAELLCLKGATDVLANVKYIETEVSIRPVYEGGILLSELEPWLNSKKFYRKTYMRRSHMNAIFTKK